MNINRTTNKAEKALLIIAIALTLTRVACHSIAEPSIAGDGWGYLNRAIFIHEQGKLPPLHIQPVGYSIALAKLIFLGKENLLNITTEIQQAFDFVTIFILAVFSFSLSKRLPHAATRTIFVLSCLALLLLQPFTAKLSSSLHTEPVVMFLSFIGVTCLSLFLDSPKIQKLSDAFIGAVGCSFMGIASTMRVDIFALNTVFLVTICIALAALNKPYHARRAACFLLASLMIPISLLVTQYRTTRELGFQTYENQTYPIEFISWTGSWRADRNEHAKYAWFSSNIDNLNTTEYPVKAFSSISEKVRVDKLFEAWKSDGYNSKVALGFKDIVRIKRLANPIKYYFLNPCYRMYHHWVNLEGADFFLSSLSVPAGPVSRFLVGIVFFLRVVFIGLFFYGSVLYIFTIRSVLRNIHSRQQQLPAPSSSATSMVGLSIIFTIMRTFEMGILSTLNAGGLMEPRYMTVAVPFALLVCIYGGFRLACAFQPAEDDGTSIS